MAVDANGDPMAAIFPTAFTQLVTAASAAPRSEFRHLSRGRLSNIKSEWGGGLFLEHGLWEVPESYGNVVRFYPRLHAEKAEEAFLEYCRSQDDFDDFVSAFDFKDSFEQPEANIRD